jgi:hypothetical protein
MRSKSRLVVAVIWCVAVIVLAIAGSTASRAQNAAEPVPAFHASAPQGRFPDTLSSAEFSEVVVQNAYLLASRVKKILYQQPCYCHCDRSQGHTSLLDCFASKHGSECGVCMREAIYSYEQSHKGKTAAQIRAGIERGEWRDVDMSKYNQPLTAR